MSILIKGMEMPKNCDACSFACWSNLHQTGSCYLLDSKQCFDDYSTDYRTKRSEHCPLIEVPEPHGRLIDADALHKLFEDQWHYLQVLDWNENPTAEANQSGINWCINTMHDDAPTVIPASEEG